MDNDISTGKILSLQALRGIAFIFIFTHHFGNTSLGPAGVSIFFVLSGFLVFFRYCNDFSKHGLRYNIDFAVMRIKKLYLLHVVCVFFALVLSKKIDWFCLITHLCLIQSLVPEPSCYYGLNPVAWFLSSLFICYILAPSCGYWLVKKTGIKQIVFFLLMWIGSAWLLSLFYDKETIYWVTYICPLFRFGDFFSGMILAWVYRNVKFQSYRSIKHTFFELVAICGLTVLHFMYRNSLYSQEFFFLEYTIVYLPLSLLIVSDFYWTKGMVVNCLCNKLMVFIGNYSGLGFLIHYIIITLFKSRLVILCESEIVICGILFFLTLVFAIQFQYIQKKLN